MRQTLFPIPHVLFGWPVFGCGWLLAVWLLGTGIALLRLRKRHGWSGETLSFLPIMAVGAAIIWLVLPHVEEVPAAGPPLGLPIRGYGVMFSSASRIEPTDRWAGAAYMRALQLSRHATLEDVPPAQRASLESRAP